MFCVIMSTQQGSNFDDAFFDQLKMKEQPSLEPTQSLNAFLNFLTLD